MGNAQWAIGNGQQANTFGVYQEHSFFLKTFKTPKVSENVKL